MSGANSSQSTQKGGRIINFCCCLLIGIGVVKTRRRRVVTRNVTAAVCFVYVDY